ncbi:FAD-binding protein [Bradyrhizobium sp. HKCCYLS20291]|uniref:FAD-binding oxidoreductase n=1 Tax=Bradyrhizobium sp. HKCCYLS20291 TaxID=3420766 RepID=UPI003EBD1F46
MSDLAGWGNYPRIPTEPLAPLRLDAVAPLLAGRTGVVARGQGRAYGDAAIGMAATMSSNGLNRMRSFDPARGELTVEAGVTIADILTAFVPRGYFLKVVPGTKFVSVGGAIAADVHGKNHHRDGGFGDQLIALRLALPSGEIVTCSRHSHAELFHATIGGMGLTGIIVEATLSLMPITTGWLVQETHVAADLDAAIAALEATAGHTYSVAWIDCLARGPALGRSLIYAADHASPADKDRFAPARDAFPPQRRSGPTMPAFVPSFALNPLTVRAFNAIYYGRGSQQPTPQLVHWDPYFFPLDTIAHWNRIYGPRGFLQHQCVIPADAARSVLAEILDRVARRGSASFLAVLKQLGDSHGLMSFPLRGYTLAMDFPVQDSLFGFLDELDGIVAKAGGRIYLAKDARQSRATFTAGYAGIEALRDIRRRIGATEKLVSHLSARLGI